MIDPDEDTLRVIVSLQGDPRGMKFLEWIQASRKEAERALYENTAFNAGRVAELADIERNVEEAKGKLDELRKIGK